MKLLGGEWSRGDAIALVGVVVALVGSVAAILAIPGMPKLLHLDREDKQTKDPRSSAMAAVNRTKDVTSGSVNFGCDQTLQIETPIVSFGLNARNVDSQPVWAGIVNSKSNTQTAANVESSTDHHLMGVKAVGSITGLDSQTIAFGIKNCPGGGHGELKMHVTWTEDKPADQP